MVKNSPISHFLSGLEIKIRFFAIRFVPISYPVLYFHSVSQGFKSFKNSVEAEPAPYLRHKIRDQSDDKTVNFVLLGHDLDFSGERRLSGVRKTV